MVISLACQEMRLTPDEALYAAMHGRRRGAGPAGRGRQPRGRQVVRLHRPRRREPPRAAVPWGVNLVEGAIVGGAGRARRARPAAERRPHDPHRVRAQLLGGAPGRGRRRDRRGDRRRIGRQRARPPERRGPQPQRGHLRGAGRGGRRRRLPRRRSRRAPHRPDEARGRAPAHGRRRRRAVRASQGRGHAGLRRSSARRRRAHRSRARRAGLLLRGRGASRGAAQSRRRARGPVRGPARGDREGSEPGAGRGRPCGAPDRLRHRRRRPRAAHRLQHQPGFTRPRPRAGDRARDPRARRRACEGEGVGPRPRRLRAGLDEPHRLPRDLDAGRVRGGAGARRAGGSRDPRERGRRVAAAGRRRPRPLDPHRDRLHLRSGPRGAHPRDAALYPAAPAHARARPHSRATATARARASSSSCSTSRSRAWPSATTGRGS